MSFRVALVAIAVVAWSAIATVAVFGGAGPGEAGGIGLAGAAVAILGPRLVPVVW